MQHNRLQNRRPVMLAGIVTAVCLLLTGPARVSAQEQVDPSKYLYDLGFTFQPASTCMSDKCHGAAAGAVKKTPGHPDAKMDSYTLWNADATADAPPDPHHTSFAKLSEKRALDIGTKLQLKDAPSKSEKCIACHALNPPPAVAGKLTPADGVSCNACHGPSGKWDDLHKNPPAGPKTWAEQQRAALGGGDEAKGAKALLTSSGFFSTRLLIDRAQRCVSCHLAIDPEMVTAGHPQPAFELNWFSVTYPNRHWNDPHDDKDPLASYFEARLWAAGQVASLRDAFVQLADRADPKNTKATPKDITNAYYQVYAHYTVFAALFGAGKATGNFGAVTTAFGNAYKVLSDPAKRQALADAAKAGKDATEALNPVVASYAPTQATAEAMAKAIAKSALADTGAFGIEQQRDALFALYDADAKAGNNAATAIRDAIGQKLFPTEQSGAFVPADQIAADKAKLADYKKALTELGIP